MKLKTNKLLTLTLASSLVAITACGGGGTKATPSSKGGGTPDPVTYSAWEAGVTQATVDTANAFLAGTAATGSGATAVDANLTGLPTGTDATILTLAYEVEGESDTSGTAPNIVKGLNAETLGGVATNGVGFATIGAAGTSRFFAGVIAGADLGAPLTTTTAGGTWNGIFQALGDADHATEKAFVLNVNFADNEISAHIAAGTDADTEVFTADVNSYYLEGTFVTATGLITGNIIFGDYSAGADDAASLALAVAALGTATGDSATAPQTVGLGVLSGLIGTNGALGAFHSSGSDGQTATGFAGGFVATTAANAGGDDPDAVYADWAAGATLVTSATAANGFVAGSATGLGIAALTGLSTLNLAEEITEKVDTVPGARGNTAARAGTAGTDGVNLGGSALNGVAFGSNGATTGLRYFAGLHNTTDLGEPIAAAADITGTWAGLFQAVGATGYAVEKAFTLTVTFSATAANTITGLVPVGASTFATAGDDSYYISGTYNADGVITGNILYGDFSAATTDALARTAAGTALTTATGTTGSPSTVGLGVLSGLIGQDGAVGAFHSSGSDGTGVTGYAGGFVASTEDDVTDAAIALVAYAPAEYSDWVAGATQAATLGTANGFVAGSTTSITLAPNGVTPVDLRDGAASGALIGGVSFFNNPGATPATTARYYAGLHTDTELGAPFPLTNAPAGTWDGMFAAVGDSDHATTAKSVTGLLAVTFGASPTIQGSVPAGAATTITVGTTAVYHINATYDANGVISGSILYEDSATSGGLATAGTYADTAGFGRVSGLIGADGAIGAFHSDNAADGNGVTGYAGGFFAKP